MLKFPLSTSLLCVALVAMALSWYVEHTSRGSFTGSWKGSRSPRFIQNGYSTTLDIRQDGTFTKVQRGRWVITTFNGTYSIIDGGLVEFHVSEVSSRASFDEEERYSLDRTFLCRCAIDRTGFLVIYEYPAFDKSLKDGSFSSIKWETYTPANAE